MPPPELPAFPPPVEPPLLNPPPPLLLKLDERVWVCAGVLLGTVDGLSTVPLLWLLELLPPLVYVEDPFSAAAL